MKRILAVFAVLLLASPAFSQVLSPELKGSSITKRPITVACMQAVHFKELMKSGEFELLFANGVSSDTSQKMMKVIFANAKAELVVANILDEHEVCIVDIFEENTYTTPHYNFKALKKQQPEVPGN